MAGHPLESRALEPIYFADLVGDWVVEYSAAMCMVKDLEKARATSSSEEA